MKSLSVGGMIVLEQFDHPGRAIDRSDHAFASKEIAGEGPATGRGIQHDSARGRSDTPHCRLREAGLR